MDMIFCSGFGLLMLYMVISPPIQQNWYKVLSKYIFISMLIILMKCQPSDETFSFCEYFRTNKVSYKLNN
jgi:abortive infection bacteriophage resistance protein